MWLLAARLLAARLLAGGVLFGDMVVSAAPFRFAVASAARWGQRRPGLSLRRALFSVFSGGHSSSERIVFFGALGRSVFPAAAQAVLARAAKPSRAAPQPPRGCHACPAPARWPPFARRAWLIFGAHPLSCSRGRMLFGASGRSALPLGRRPFWRAPRGLLALPPPLPPPATAALPRLPSACALASARAAQVLVWRALGDQ